MKLAHLNLSEAFEKNGKLFVITFICLHGKKSLDR
jgi:hypothetical protein